MKKTICNNILILLKSDTLLAKIDEAIINYHTCELYSWLKIGMEKI